MNEVEMKEVMGILYTLLKHAMTGEREGERERGKIGMEDIMHVT